jgi:uncharacterized protein YjbI with pentapeptide repeats
MDITLKDAAEFNAAVKDNPTLLDNRSIQGIQLNKKSGNQVVLEDLTIHNLTLREVQMRGAKLKNVTFVDCRFIKVDFDESSFSNVKFIRGSFAGYAQPSDRKNYLTTFRKISIDRVLFDAVNFDKSVDINLHDGVVVMRNITANGDTNNNTNLLLSGSNLNIRMDNCAVTNQCILNLQGNNNSAYITNCRFSNTISEAKAKGTPANWDPSLRLQGTAAWIENCILAGSTPACKKTVITNCVLGDVSIRPGGENSAVFLSKNKWVPQTSEDMLRLFVPAVDIQETAYLYLYGNGVSISFPVSIGTGNVNIYDTEISELSMRQQRAETVLCNLNLLNVTIKKGDFEYADLRDGKWQHVRLGSPIDLDKAKIGKITSHYVEFTNGYPWVNGKLDLVDSSQPLEFDKPPVPTLEELGLAQFWKENDFPKEQY